jgi:hypothetical protein
MTSRKSARTPTAKGKVVSKPRTTAEAAAKPRTLDRSSRQAPAPAGAGRLDLPVFVREQRVAEAAYFRAQRRGFAPGGELEDWLEAEVEIDRLPGG